MRRRKNAVKNLADKSKSAAYQKFEDEWNKLYGGMGGSNSWLRYAWTTIRKEKGFDYSSDGDNQNEKIERFRQAFPNWKFGDEKPLSSNREDPSVELIGSERRRQRADAGTAIKKSPGNYTLQDVLRIMQGQQGGTSITSTNQQTSRRRASIGLSGQVSGKFDGSAASFARHMSREHNIDINDFIISRGDEYTGDQVLYNPSDMNSFQLSLNDGYMYIEIYIGGERKAGRIFPNDSDNFANATGYFKLFIDNLQ